MKLKIKYLPKPIKFFPAISRAGSKYCHDKLRALVHGVGGDRELFKIKDRKQTISQPVWPGCLAKTTP